MLPRGTALYETVGNRREAIARPWGSFYVRPCNVLLEVRFIRGSLQIDHAGGRVFRAPRVLGILAILAPRQSVHSATRQQLQTKCCARLPLIVQGPSLLASWRKVGPLRNEGSPVLFSLGGLGGLVTAQPAVLNSPCTT